MDNSYSYENLKLREDAEKINRAVILSEKSEEIYGHITSLINSITSKEAYDKLEEINKSDSRAFCDPVLLVKVYAALSRFRFKQSLRKVIMNYFDVAITSPEVVDAAMKILNGIGKNLFMTEEREK